MEVGWKDLIDDLATHLMIQGEGPETIVRLHALADRAQRENAPGLPDLLGDLLSRLGSDSQAGTQYLLQHGINALQGAVETTQTSSAPARQAALAEDAELVSDFLVEAREHLSQIEGQMLVLERDPSEMEVIHTVFRAFHTIKGLAGFLDFATVQAVAHEVETLLDLARNEKLVIGSAIVDVVLESGDFLLTELGSIEAALNTGEALRVADHSGLAGRIRALSVAGPDTRTAPSPAATTERLAAAEKDTAESLSFTPADSFWSSQPAPAPTASNYPAELPHVPGAPTGDLSAAVLIPMTPAVDAALPEDAPDTTLVASDGKGFIKLFSPQERAAMLAANMPSVGVTDAVPIANSLPDVQPQPPAPSPENALGTTESRPSSPPNATSAFCYPATAAGEGTTSRRRRGFSARGNRQARSPDGHGGRDRHCSITHSSQSGLRDRHRLPPAW